ncbi:hypothetical protein J1N35_023591 [Gossypium stocksii]|uniref:Uncharacterized protein n=1 Tax=Gossypium stocksii TaxID=47602 RepID=A0A9D4A425_9ROSI|nr:hypothetical protein J1N35_023591 [Gossypium stocksii]
MVPTEEVLSFGDDNFIRFEEAGIKEAQDAAFVLVEGGLGERLGYNGINVDNLKTCRELWKPDPANVANVKALFFRLYDVTTAFLFWYYLLCILKFFIIFKGKNVILFR